MTMSYVGLDTKKSLSLSKCPNYVWERDSEGYFATHFNIFHPVPAWTRVMSVMWSQYNFYTPLLHSPGTYTLIQYSNSKGQQRY